MLAFQKRLPYSPPLPIGGTARPVWAAVAVRKRRKTGDENAQAQDEERRQKTLQAHRHRQGETRRRWQAPPAFQPQCQVHPSKPRHRCDFGRRRPRDQALGALRPVRRRSEEHTSELQSLMRISYAVFCLKKKKTKTTTTKTD